MMACNFCKVPIYIKTVQYTAPLLAPMTEAEELRQRLTNITGEVYLPMINRYCPMCGRNLESEVDTE